MRALAFLAMFCVVLAACGTSTPASTPIASARPTATFTPSPISMIPLVKMGATTFTGPTNLRIHVETPIEFIDPLNTGGIHVLYIDSASNPIAGAPKALVPPKNYVFEPGHSMDFIFTQPGTFYVKCQPHPAMLVTITIIP